MLMELLINNITKWLVGECFVITWGSSKRPLQRIWVTVQRFKLSNLNVAHEKGFNAIFIESDSLLSVSLVCGVYLRTHPCFNLIEDICTGMKRFRVVHLKHIWWEANQVANKLAKNGLWPVIFVFFILLLLSRFLYWQCNFCSLPSWVLIQFVWRGLLGVGKGLINLDFHGISLIYIIIIKHELGQFIYYNFFFKLQYDRFKSLI